MVAEIRRKPSVNFIPCLFIILGVRSKIPKNTRPYLLTPDFEKDGRVGIIQNGRLPRSNTQTSEVNKLQCFIDVHLFDVRAPCGKQ